MKKILLIVHDYFPNYIGGTEGYTHDLAHSLAERGYKVMIYTQELQSETKNELEVEKYKEGSVTIFKVHRKHVLQKTEFKKTYFNNENDQVFRKALSDFSPDIVHVQHLIYNSLSLIDIIKEANIPIVYTVHDLWFRCPMVKGYLNDGPCLCTDNKASGICSAMVSGGDSMIKIQNKLIRFLARIDWRNQRIERNKVIRNSLLKADRLVVPSEYLKREVTNFINNQKEVLKNPTWNDYSSKRINKK